MIGSRPTVLVAEDDAELRDLICQRLVSAGCSVESYPTGEQLWRALVHRVDILGVPPDLIVTDVRMPGRTGLDVVRQLRRYDRVTPVIVVTAFGDEHAASSAEQLGAHLIPKPFDLDQLLQAAVSAGVIR
ncbi:MAG: response regulator [Myxococcaceae bacterium]